VDGRVSLFQLTSKRPHVAALVLKGASCPFDNIKRWFAKLTILEAARRRLPSSNRARAAPHRRRTRSSVSIARDGRRPHRARNREEAR